MVKKFYCYSNKIDCKPVDYKNAKEAKIHEPVDYAKNPEEYCGMTISDNPYYDY